MTRRPRRSVAVGVILLVASLVLELTACGGSSAPAAPPYGSGRGAPTLAQVTAVLQRHAASVVARSPQRFLADVDRASSSATFRATQTAQIRSLSSVPLSSWSYAVSSPVTDVSAVKAAASRFGAPTSIVHLTLSYALAAVDRLPVTHDLWWTFVQRHGHVYVAGDADMAGLGGQSWRGPWDFGPVVVHRGASSLVLGHPADAERLATISGQVDAAVSSVTAVWGTDWNRDVAVIVAGSSAEFTALGGSSGSGATGADISAETIFETSNGADAAARVLMNPSVLTTLTTVGRGIVLRHEVTHVATIASTPIGTPSWLVEGFADYVGNLGSGQTVLEAASELHAELHRGKVPNALPTDADFASTTRRAAVYEQAWLACRVIAARAGPSGLVQLYRLVGASLDVASVAVTTAVRTVLHESVPEFTAQWRTYLIGALG